MSIAQTLVPFMAVEIDNSNAVQGPTNLPYRALVIGQKLASGTATADTIIGPFTSADQLITPTGSGSMLHRQAMAWFTENGQTETYFGVLADNGAGVAATGTLTVTGPATASGTLSIYIGGQLVSVGVTVGDAQNTIAAAINTAINAAIALPVTSTVATNVVTVAARNKGLPGNFIDLRLNYQTGDVNPAGVTVAIAAMSGGTTNPTLTALITAMADVWYNVMTMPYGDTTSLSAMETELARRFGPFTMVDGILFVPVYGTQSAISAITVARNSQFVVHVAPPGRNEPTPGFEFAASYAAAYAREAAIDPARPVQTVQLYWPKPPAKTDEFTFAERNLLLTNGAGTSKVGPGSTVQMERAATTYRLNAAGAPDPSYKDATTLSTLALLRYRFRTQILQKYARAKLADDTARLGPNQQVITPKIGKAEAVAWFGQAQFDGLVEPSDAAMDAFKAAIVVYRDSVNANRLNWYLPPDLINQFISGAATVGFKL